MTDEANETNEDAVEDTAPAPAGYQPKNHELKLAVATRIAGAGPEITERVVEVLAHKEIQRRTDAVMSVMDKIAQLDKEAKAFLKPDNITYDADGKEVSKTWNKTTIDAKKKNQEQRDKLNKALDAALASDKPDWTKLLEAAK